MQSDTQREIEIAELVAAWLRFEPPAPPGPPVRVVVLCRDGKPLCMAPSLFDLADVCGDGRRPNRSLHFSPRDSIVRWG